MNKPTSYHFLRPDTGLEHRTYCGKHRHEVKHATEDTDLVTCKRCLNEIGILKEKINYMSHRFVQVMIDMLLENGVDQEIINKAKEKAINLAIEKGAKHGGNEWTGTYLLLDIDDIYASGFHPVDFVERGWVFSESKQTLVKRLTGNLNIHDLLKTEHTTRARKVA